MPNSFAFVSLLTSDNYLPGALALAAALRDVHSSPSSPADASPFDLVCLVTPETVDVKSVKLLRRAYTHVIGVEVIQQPSSEGLRLLGRPDLTRVLTKLHAFRLTEYSKIVFLDADILPLQPLAHLFQLPHDFAAVPDVGWPDIFNSGMMLFQPGKDKFNNIMSLVQSHGSWDGGDQGILNEWRGKDWHRLSFVYNTTPTAAYTYAPAYKRFGQNIKAIHFIGSNKPWSSLQYRAPFSPQSLDALQSKPAAFGYGDLVDRWYAVYDRHYRLEKQPDYDEKLDDVRYESAWNIAHSATAEPQTLSLEDLRRMAVEGSGAKQPLHTETSSQAAHIEPKGHDRLRGSWEGDQNTFPQAEGQYRSLPLEGRFDLMPAQPISSESRTGDEGSAPGLTPATTSTPSYTAPPSAPWYSQGAAGVAATQSQEQPTQHPDVAYLQSPQAQNRDGSDYWQAFPQAQPAHFETPQERPRSPPLIHWNPAVEPPPSIPPPQTAFQPSTHFENVWDAPQGQSSHTDGGGFFVAPTQAKIPEHLIREGHYSNVVQQVSAAPAFAPQHQVVGYSQEVAKPNTSHGIITVPRPTEEPVSYAPPHHVDPYRPDKTKVAAVFPWEAKPRHMPGRIFPRAASPPPATSTVYIAPSPPAPEPPSPVPAQDGLSRPGTLSPSSSSSKVFQNAWDTVPSIQRYAQKLQKPPQLAAAAAAAATVQSSSPKGKRSRRSSSSTYKSREDAEGSSSHEADVEDEGNDSSDGQNGSTNAKRPGRRVSRTSPIFQDEQTGKTYRSQSVQTINAIRKEKSVQWNSSELSTDPPALPSSTTPKPPPPTALPRRLFSQFTTGGKVLGGQELPGSPSIDEAPVLPNGGTKLITDRVEDGNQSPFPQMSPVASFKGFQKPIARPIYPRSSSETISSQGPFSPPESQTIPLPMSSSVAPAEFSREPLSPTRPMGRNWDPARGVDVFKRESQEVLARFLRMGSWDGSPTT